eukprot:CAMPEP_0198138152 /NCGR_PEP_ID=MMETSP1443-20131203/1572_1 /TAXON_ID=186043 /ORGANISM="Entomoneis sp., Strain CCMP2396" /LENGTH=264 /DNA_ID=CAMNT_0043799807 /DNA_START=40 /DNA_END=834 /DNA_ORIENTATION=+
MAAAGQLRRLLTSSEVRWGTAGWSFFIAENFFLSENRTFLIDYLGDDNYHLMYGTISTIATASIGYSYYKLKKLQPKISPSSIPTGNLVVAWGLVSVGLGLASQALPKMQIPVAIKNSANGGSKLQVLCPFDFADKHRDSGDGTIRGLERVSRHPGLWSFGLISAGNAMIQSNMALRMWWCGPAAVAWLGGMHTDSRFKRGMGGQLDPIIESQTSNIPFLALLSGKQGSPITSFSNLQAETKPLNALIAVGAATAFILSRGRIR